MFTGLGSIIGSGWLFGAWRAAQLAGPGAVYAWIIGAVIIMFVAFTYAELGAMFPESGGAVRYGHYSHGSLVGFVAGWAAWIAIVSVIPGGGRGLGAVHELLALGLGTGAVSARRQRPGRTERARSLRSAPCWWCSIFWSISGA